MGHKVEEEKKKGKKGTLWTLAKKCPGKQLNLLGDICHASCMAHFKLHIWPFYPWQEMPRGNAKLFIFCLKTVNKLFFMVQGLDAGWGHHRAQNKPSLSEPPAVGVALAVPGALGKRCVPSEFIARWPCRWQEENQLLTWHYVLQTKSISLWRLWAQNCHARLGYELREGDVP